MSDVVLLTGPTGYVGGRLRRLLEERGCAVRCLARPPEQLAERVSASTEVVQGDVLDPKTLVPALEGVETAYYLVHSMGAGHDFEERDRAGARTTRAPWVTAPQPSATPQRKRSRCRSPSRRRSRRRSR